MSLDRFDDSHMNISYPHKDEPKIYSTCSGCGEEIYEDDECLETYGMAVHYDFYCLIKATQSRRLIANDGETE